MKTTKAILTVLITLFAATASAQTATELVNKYKGQDGVKTEDYMPDVKRMVEMFKGMPEGQGGPGMGDMTAMTKALEGIKTYNVCTLPADKVAAVKADIEALKDYTNLIEFVEDAGGQGGFGMPEPKVGEDGVRRLQLPNMFQQQGGAMQAYAKVTDNKFNEVIVFTAGPNNNALSYVEATDLTVDYLMMIMMMPMMRNMQQGGGF